MRTVRHRPGPMASLAAGVMLVTAAAASAETLAISSFETEAELARWEIAGERELSGEHATDGQHALRIRWPQGRGLITRGFPADWSPWEVLKLDCFNPGPPFSVTLRTDDATGATVSSWYHSVRSGKSTLEFVIPGLAERIDVARIRMAHLRVDPARQRPVEVYFDNLRFTRGEPAEVYQPPAVAARPLLRHQVNLLANPDFEVGLQGWQAQPQAGPGSYEYGTGTGENCHSGAASAAIICNRIGRGGLSSAAVRLPAAGPYSLSFWVRGTLGGLIRYGLTGGGADDLREDQATGQWRCLRATFERRQGETAAVALLSSAPGTVFFDDVCLAPGTGDTGAEQESARPAPDVAGNRITNPNFEVGMYGWDSWGQWDGGSYDFGSGEGPNAYSGASAVAVICNLRGRGGVFTQPLKLPPDAYTLRFMAKSSGTGSIRFGAVYPGGQSFRDANLGSQWQPFTVTVTSEIEGPWRVYLMSTGDGTIYFDEVSLLGAHQPAASPRPSAVPAEPPTRLTLQGGHTRVNGAPFFAIGLYRAAPADLAGTAFNCIPGWDPADRTTLDACHERGVFLLPDLTGVMRGHLPHRVGAVAQPVMDHPAVLAWYLCDEPDHERWLVPPDEMRLASRLLRDLDPAHLTCAVVMPWAESNLYRYADTVDLVMTDIYPITETRPADLASIWRSTAVLRRAVKDAKPIWVVLQATAAGTPAEHVAATYLALVEGADGVFYWEYEDARCKPAVWDTVCQLARELATLTPVLTGDDALRPATAGRGPVRCLRKVAPDGEYLLAVNGAAEPVRGWRATVPGAGDGKAQVLFEERAVTVTGAVLVDDFAAFARHVYKLP